MAKSNEIKDLETLLSESNIDAEIKSILEELGVDETAEKTGEVAETSPLKDTVADGSVLDQDPLTKKAIDLGHDEPGVAGDKEVVIPDEDKKVDVVITVEKDKEPSVDAAVDATVDKLSAELNQTELGESFTNIYNILSDNINDIDEKTFEADYNEYKDDGKECISSDGIEGNSCESDYLNDTTIKMDLTESKEEKKEKFKKVKDVGSKTFDVAKPLASAVVAAGSGAVSGYFGDRARKYKDQKGKNEKLAADTKTARDTQEKVSKDLEQSKTAKTAAEKELADAKAAVDAAQAKYDSAVDKEDIHKAATELEKAKENHTNKENAVKDKSANIENLEKEKIIADTEADKYKGVNLDSLDAQNAQLDKDYGENVAGSTAAAGMGALALTDAIVKTVKTVKKLKKSKDDDKSVESNKDNKDSDKEEVVTESVLTEEYTKKTYRKHMNTANIVGDGLAALGAGHIAGKSTKGAIDASKRKGELEDLQKNMNKLSDLQNKNDTAAEKYEEADKQFKADRNNDELLKQRDAAQREAEAAETELNNTKAAIENSGFKDKSAQEVTDAINTAQGDLVNNSLKAAGAGALSLAMLGKGISNIVRKVKDHKDEIEESAQLINSDALDILKDLVDVHGDGNTLIIAKKGELDKPGAALIKIKISKEQFKKLEPEFHEEEKLPVVTESQVALMIANENNDRLFAELVEATALANRLQNAIFEKYADLAKDRAASLNEELSVWNDTFEEETDSPAQPLIEERYVTLDDLCDILDESGYEVNEENLANLIVDIINEDVVFELNEASSSMTRAYKYGGKDADEEKPELDKKSEPVKEETPLKEEVKNVRKAKTASEVNNYYTTDFSEKKDSCDKECEDKENCDCFTVTKEVENHGDVCLKDNGANSPETGEIGADESDIFDKDESIDVKEVIVESEEFVATAKEFLEENDYEVNDENISLIKEAYMTGTLNELDENLNEGFLSGKIYAKKAAALTASINKKREKEQDATKELAKLEKVVNKARASGVNIEYADIDGRVSLSML